MSSDFKAHIKGLKTGGKSKEKQYPNFWNNFSRRNIINEPRQTRMKKQEMTQRHVV